MNGMGCTGEAGQTGGEGGGEQFLKVHHSTWNKPYIQFVELMEGSGL